MKTIHTAMTLERAAQQATTLYRQALARQDNPVVGFQPAGEIAVRFSPKDKRIVLPITTESDGPIQAGLVPADPAAVTAVENAALLEDIGRRLEHLHSTGAVVFSSVEQHVSPVASDELVTRRIPRQYAPDLELTAPRLAVASCSDPDQGACFGLHVYEVEPGRFACHRVDMESPYRNNVVATAIVNGIEGVAAFCQGMADAGKLVAEVTRKMSAPAYA